LDFQGLTLGGGLGADREILTDARTIEPTGDTKTISPEGFVNSEMMN